MKTVSTTAALALALTIGGGVAAAAKQEPFGANIGGWWFTSEYEKPGMVNCRAHLRFKSGHLAIMAMRTNDEAYVSVNAGKVKGSYPNSWLQLANDAIPVLAKVYGDRLVFAPLTEEQLRMIADQGGYTWTLADKADTTATVTLPESGLAVERLIECVRSNQS